MSKLDPAFHEQWYLDIELALLEAATGFVNPLQGAVIEIGCWQGRSAAVMANACYPDILIAVDTWGGSVTEHPDHETVRIAKVRDVFAAFIANMQRATRGNFECHRSEAISFLKSWAAPIKFCHIDAAHDYDSELRYDCDGKILRNARRARHVAPQWWRDRESRPHRPCRRTGPRRVHDPLP
jgi:hypothetical protein